MQCAIQAEIIKELYHKVSHVHFRAELELTVKKSYVY